MDRDARAAIEKLHKDTHDFAVAIVQEVDALNERIDTTAAAVEQQMEMLLTSGQGAQQWQEIAQKGIGQTRANLVAGLGRVTVLESSIQAIREDQQKQDLKKEVLELVTTQLQTFEAQVDARVREWTETTVQGCQEMVEQLESIQEQLGEIQERQTDFQAAFDSIRQRLEQVEMTRLR